MTKQDWDKCFVWLMAAFPQWKVEAATSAVWFDEIGGLDKTDFVSAVRSIMAKNPSPFPPGVFEIKAEVTPIKSLHPGPEEAWGIALAATDENKSVVWTDEIAEAQGACWEQVRARDMIGARMAFLEKYKQLIAEANRENRPPTWRATLGFNKSGRDEAQEIAGKKNEEIRQLTGEGRKLLR